MDDYNDSPSGGSEAAISAVVKWYNPTKGFGFVQPAGEERDAFLHVSVCEAAGLREVIQGTVLRCTLEERQRGLQVVAIHSVESIPEGPPEHAGHHGHHGGHHGHRGPPREAERSVSGTVKFYNRDKGYGFVMPEDGGQDIFVAGRLLARFGIDDLEPGQALQLKTREGPKGPVASFIQLL